MDKIIHTKNSFQFGVSTEFTGKFLVPIMDNVKTKAQTNWDDYNEVYHCSKLIHQILSNPKMHLDFHFIRKNEEYLGILLVTSGEIDYPLFFKEFSHAIDNSIILNYFHISKNGRGNGEYWLKNIIFPYYQKQGIATAFIKSSHSLVFPLYSRLGTEIGDYQSESDNKLLKREGKIFQIKL